MTRTWRTQDTAPAYEPPAIMPDDPAETARHDYERRFVQAKRGAGVSWQNIARMLGKCEAQLRGEYGGLG